MKRLVYLLAICLSFAAHADLMWQRNHGAWEKVVRVKRGEDYVSHGFRSATNAWMTFYHTWATTTVVYRVDYDKYYMGGSNHNTLMHEVFHCFAGGELSLVTLTNDLARDATSVTFDVSVEKLDIRTHTKVSNGTVDLPCRLGVPASVVVTPPYEDLLELLPLSYPDTTIRVKIDFDGYLLLRFFDDDNRLQIKRLLPEKLPYEHPRRNIRVLRDDLLNGV